MLDHSHTKVILIGNSKYPKWRAGNVPNINVNLKNLKGLLCNPMLIGIKNDQDTILELLNNKKVDILNQIDDFMGKCGPDNCLLVYYAGHGLPDVNDLKKLYLSTADTRIDKRSNTCIPSDELKEKLIKCKAARKIMILDCCYAGKMVGLLSDPESIGGNIWGDTEGVYFMMSSDRDIPSRFDPKDKTIPTFFTQKLIQTIEDGDGDNNDIWTLDALFEVMKRKWDIKIAPEPLRLSYKEIGNLPFCYNKLAIAGRIKIKVNSDENTWQEIEKNPDEKAIRQFIELCGNESLIQNAVDLLAKMLEDWNLLAIAMSDPDPTAIGKFLKERKPCKPIFKIAVERLLSILIITENNTRALVDKPIQTRPIQPKDSQRWTDRPDNGYEGAI